MLKRTENMYTLKTLEGGLNVDRLTGAAIVLLSFLASTTLSIMASEAHPFALTFIGVFNLAGYIVGFYLAGRAHLNLRRLRDLEARHASR